MKNNSIGRENKGNNKERDKNNKNGNKCNKGIGKEEQDDNENKLQLVLELLGLSNVSKVLLSMKLTFIDFLLLTKEDVIDLNLELYQRNRIISFIRCYMSNSKDNTSSIISNNKKEYSLNEIVSFFNQHRQFIFIQLDQPITIQSAYELIDNIHKDDNNTSLSESQRKDTEIKLESKPDKDIDKEQKENKGTQNGNNINLQNNIGSKDNNDIIETKKKRIIHSNTADPSLRKSIKGNENKNSNPFYQSYIQMNKDTENILHNLRKAKEESEYKHSLYSSLLNKNMSYNSGSNSSRVLPNANANAKITKSQFNSDRLNEEKAMSSNIKKLYEMMNKKESLIKNLNECNKSITEKKKMISYLNEDNKNFNINSDNINNNNLEKVDERREEDDV